LFRREAPLNALPGFALADCGGGGTSYGESPAVRDGPRKNRVKSTQKAIVRDRKGRQTKAQRNLLIRYRRSPKPKLLFLLPLLPLAACLPGASDDYDPLAFAPQGDALVLTGVIDARALPAFAEAMDAYPETETLILQSVPGSADDDANLELARQVRALGLTTVVPSDGVVASGGTDLFLAGTMRQIGDGACIGVHSWGDSQIGAGSDVPREDPVHQLYLDYYREIGIDPEFYWFTLEAASVEDIHWMRVAEQTRFGMGNPASQGRADVSLSECEARLEGSGDG